MLHNSSYIPKEKAASTRPAAKKNKQTETIKTVQKLQLIIGVGVGL